MAERLSLEVVTPGRRVLVQEADEVRIPGLLGELGVLPGHTPLLTSLGTGQLSWFNGSETGGLALQGGFAEVLSSRVTVLAMIAELPEEIDVEAARVALAETEEALKAVSAEELDDLTAAVRLAETRIQVAGGNAV